MNKRLIVLACLAIGCQKQNLNEGNPTSEHFNEGLNFKQIEFIESLKYDIRNAEVNRDLTDVFNPDNPMEYVGTYLHDMITQVAEEETLSRSQSLDALKARFTGYADDHPFSLQATAEFSGLFEQELRNLITENGSPEMDKETSITNLKLIESALASTSLLDADDQDLLLGYCAALKYFRSDLETVYNIINEIDPAGLSSTSSDYWDCVDQTLGSDLGNALSDFDNHPTSTLLNWLGLPSTIMTCSIDAMWQCR